MLSKAGAQSTGDNSKTYTTGQQDLHNWAARLTQLGSKTYTTGQHQLIKNSVTAAFIGAGHGRNLALLAFTTPRGKRFNGIYPRCCQDIELTSETCSLCGKI